MTNRIALVHCCACGRYRVCGRTKTQNQKKIIYTTPRITTQHPHITTLKRRKIHHTTTHKPKSSHSKIITSDLDHDMQNSPTSHNHTTQHNTSKLDPSSLTNTSLDLTRHSHVFNQHAQQCQCDQCKIARTESPEDGVDEPSILQK